jgi:hypothetical protein
LKDYLLKYHHYANPNLKIVKKVIEDNRDFLDKKRASLDEE